MDLTLSKIVELVDKKKAENISIIDFRNQSPYIDYFVVCSVNNSRLANAIIEEVEEFAENNNLNILSKDSSKDAQWALIDVDNIVVHCFVGEERKKYDLDGLWKDLIIEY